MPETLNPSRNIAPPVVASGRSTQPQPEYHAPLMPKLLGHRYISRPDPPFALGVPPLFMRKLPAKPLLGPLFLWIIDWEPCEAIPLSSRSKGNLEVLCHLSSPEPSAKVEAALEPDLAGVRGLLHGMRPIPLSMHVCGASQTVVCSPSSPSPELGHVLAGVRSRRRR